MTDLQPLDLVVRSRRLYTAGEWCDGAVAVRGGTIVGVVSGDVELDAARVIDAGDRPVLPGAIDTHAHFRDPGYTYKEDFESGTRAAAAGGVTTVIDMPNVEPTTDTAERLQAHLANAATKAVVDFGHNALGVIPENIASMAAAGASGFKIWQMADIGRSYPHSSGTSVTDHGTLYHIFEEVAKTGLPLYVHPHDQELYQLFVERSQEQWGMDFRSYARALRGGDSIVLDAAIRLLLRIQTSTGAHLHLCHMTSSDGIQMVRQAKAAGNAITCETNPIALFVTSDWSRLEKVGPYGLGFWVPPRDAEAMWEAVRDGTIDVIGSDHGPHTKEEKEQGWEDMYAAPGGAPFIQHYFAMLLTKVNDGTLSMERVIDLCAVNPAKLLGIYPRKGCITPGADADMVVVDMDHTEVLRASESLYRCGWMPYEGETITAKPTVTVRRGEVIFEDGEVRAQAGSGRHIKGTI